MAWLVRKHVKYLVVLGVIIIIDMIVGVIYDDPETAGGLTVDILVFAFIIWIGWVIIDSLRNRKVKQKQAV